MVQHGAVKYLSFFTINKQLASTLKKQDEFHIYYFCTQVIPKFYKLKTFLFPTEIFKSVHFFKLKTFAIRDLRR